MQNSISTFIAFFSYAKPWRGKILWASFCSVTNKIFDIAPEILIGIYVDLVVQREQSFIAQLGFESIESQITLLAIATFLIWAFESIFEYLYSVGWKNIAQGIEHHIRIDSYSHVQNLDLEWYEQQKTGNITAILNDDMENLNNEDKDSIDNSIEDNLNMKSNEYFNAGVMVIDYKKWKMNNLKNKFIEILLKFNDKIY